MTALHQWSELRHWSCTGMQAQGAKELTAEPASEQDCGSTSAAAQQLPCHDPIGLLEEEHGAGRV